MVLGAHYTKSFQEKMQALDEALGALQERVSTLRDGAIVKTEKVVERVETHVHSLQSEMKGLNLSADRTGLTVSSIAEDVKTLAKSQDETQVKIDHLDDLQQVRDDAKRAMMIVLEETTKTSECKLGGFNSCDMKYNIDLG